MNAINSAGHGALANFSGQSYLWPVDRKGISMFAKLTILIHLVLMVCFAAVAIANPLPIIGCGWEDANHTVLNLYGTGDPPILVTNVTSPDPVYDGNRSLRLEDNSPSGTPQAFLCYIWDLNDGDQVYASFMRYDDTPDGAPSCRIWGHWNDDLPLDPDGYSGSAGGNSDYGSDVGWGLLDHTWTVADGHTGLVIEVRTYSNAGDTVWIDNFEVFPPDECTVQTPEAFIVENQSRSFDEVKALFR